MRAHNPIVTSISSTVFEQMTVECPYTLQWLPVSPSKLPLPMLAPGPHVIRDSLNPPESGTQNDNSIISAVFAGLTSVTD